MADVVEIVVKATDQASNILRAIGNNTEQAGRNMKNFGQIMLDAGKQAGLSTNQLLRLGSASGALSKDQIQAALATEKLTKKASELSKAVAAGKLSVSAAGAEYQKFVNQFLPPAVSGMEKFVGAVKQFGPAIAAAGFSALVKFTTDATKATVAYADEVRRLRQITGGSAESTSRLIQTADDLKIGTDALTMAQRRLSKEGINLTTEALAKLSDEYIAIQDPAKRAVFLQEKFGRGGFQFAEAMSKGGDAIREIAASQADNLILTNKQEIAAREYEKAVDAAEDAWAGVKYTIGNAVLPATTELINRLTGNEGIEAAFARLNKAISSGDNRYGGAKMARESMEVLQKTPEFIKWITAARERHRQAEWGLNEASEAQLMTEEELTEQLQAEYQARSELLAITDQYYQAEQQYTTNSNNLLAEKARLQDEYNKYFSLGYRSLAEGSTLGGIVEELEKVDEAINQNAESYAAATGRILYSNELRRMSVDGLEQHEVEKLQELGKQLGLTSDAALNFATRYQAVAKRLEEAKVPAEKYAEIMKYIVSLPSTIEFDVNAYLNNVLGGTGKPRPKWSASETRTVVGDVMMAKGGAASGLFWTGDSTAGLTPYSELVYAPGGAYVFNASQSRRLAGRGSVPRYARGSLVTDDGVSIPPSSGGLSMSTITGLVSGAVASGASAGGSFLSSGAASASGSTSTTAAITAAAVTSAAVAPVAQSTERAAQAGVQMAAQTSAMANQIAASQARSEQLLAAIDMRLAAMPSQIRDGMQQVVR